MSNDIIRDDLTARRPSPAIGWVVVAVLAGLMCLLPVPWAAATWRPGQASPLAAVETAALASASLLTWFLAAWTALVTALLLAARGSGRRARAARTTLRRVLPAAVRRGVAVSLGLSLLGGGVAGATSAAVVPSNLPAGVTQPGAASAAMAWWTQAGPSAVAGEVGPGTTRGVSFPTGPLRAGSAPASLVGLRAAPVADRPPAAAPGPAGRTATAPAVDVDWPAPPGGSDPEPARVVVLRGDTLWSIAARHLGGHPSDEQIASAWPAWYAANRSVIGDDPDLILPGQQLRPPASGAGLSR